MSDKKGKRPKAKKERYLKSDPERPLSKQHAMFAAEYVVDFNGAAAARRAGYSEKGARQTGANLLTIANIQREIERLLAERRKKHAITAERVLGGLAAVAFSDIGEIVAFNDKFKLIELMPESARRAIASIKVRAEPGKDGGTVTEFKMHGKVEALTKLAQHLGLFRQSSDEQGITVRLVHRIVTKRSEITQEPPIESQPDLALPAEPDDGDGTPPGDGA